MKQTNFLKSFFLLFALIVGSSSVWGSTVTLTSQQIKAGKGSTSYGACTATDGGGNTWNAYAIKNQHSNATSDYHYWQIKKYASGTAYYVQVPALGSKITQLVITVSGDSKARGGGGNSATLYFSNSNSTSATGTGVASGTGASSITIDCSSLNLNTGYITASGAVRIWDVQVTYEDAPAYTINAESNNTEWGTVSLSGSTITGAPKSGYRYASPAYTVSPANSATVSQNGNAFTVTPSANTTVTINFEAIPTYTVTFNAEGGSCGTTSATETNGGAGVTLPSATIEELDGWTFAGWAADATASTTTRPTLYKSGSTYYPTANTTLYAVYTLDGVDYEKYQRVTELSEATSASTIIIVSNKYNKVLDNALGSVNAPTETEGKITPSDNMVWALSGNNTDGFELTTTALSTNNTLGRSLIPTTSGNIELTTDNNKWIVEEHTGGTNLFVLKNKTNPSDNTKVGVLEYNATPSKWQYYCMAASTYKTSNDYSKSQLYIPVSTVFNSNPAAAIIQPTVTFEKGNTTLYLDGTTTYTNAASVTGVAKSVTGYKSSNESVATVDASGVVTAVGIGTATITAYLDIELGVHKAAEASYEVTVKNTTTIAGLKALYNAAQSPAKAFTADLTDAVVTYVNGNHAYIQDASGAIYASCGSSLTAGKKINGAVSGTITAPNTIDEIKTIDISGATVTDAEVPAAEVKTLAQIKAGDYDGKLVTVNGAVVKTGMNNATSGGVITDDGETTTFNIYAPNKLTLNATEEGNFTGFVSIYGGSTYRLNIYEESQFVKTRNVATAQPLAFAEDAIELDEETTAFAEFTGQAVEGAQGTVTYAITGDAIGTVNAETGVVTLNGACGTATITATAAAKEVTVAGVTTPYTETEESYIVTVNPRYSVTFSVNGIETVLRQSTSGATIAVPTPGDLGDYTFMGWSTSTVAPTDDAPSMTALGATVTPENNNGKYYAVFAQETEGDDENVELYKNTGSTGTDATSGITASGNINTTSSNGNPGNSFGLTSSSNKTATFTNINISTAKSASLNLDYRLAKSGSDYSSLTVTQYDSEDDVLGTPTNITGSDQNYHTSEAISLNKACVKITIVCTPAGSTYNTYVDNVTINVVRPSVSYKDYRTSLPTVEVTISESKFLSFCYGSKLDFTETDVKAYKASVDGEGKVTLTKVDVVPAGEGVVLYCETPGTYSIPVTTKDASDVTGNEMVGVLVRTQVVWNVGGKYNYILQQGQFNKANDGYLKANRAYLSTSYDVTPLGAKALSVVFAEDETDGIRSIENSRIENSDYYNLAGQKVGADYKGIVIVNGKKYMRK